MAAINLVATLLLLKNQKNNKLKENKTIIVLTCSGGLRSSINRLPFEPLKKIEIIDSLELPSFSTLIVRFNGNRKTIYRNARGSHFVNL